MNIAWPKSTFLPRCVGLIRLVMRGHLDDVCNNGNMRNSYSLKNSQLLQTRHTIQRVRLLTLGRPVVPLEVHKKASLVLPSPGESLRSVNVEGWDRPSSTSPCTVTYGMGPFVCSLSIRII